MVQILLSQRQQEVVEHNDGPILVIAGPGSGKTRVLTERVRRLLTQPSSHFRVLALTFTVKAADEMKERLSNLGDLTKRASISTIHGFCLDMLTDRGKLIGVPSQPQIFEHFSDRKQILLEAAMADPELRGLLLEIDDHKKRNSQLDDWLRYISRVKAHPVSQYPFIKETEKKIYDVYNAGLSACGAHDFDDLLLLAYQLLEQHPQIADFYRRLYGYICVDEAQDLNEAQYAVVKALCGSDFKNVMMVGDPKQSIFGFNTSSPTYMDAFEKDFGAKRVELTDNFRSAKRVVLAAQSLEPKYHLEGQLPVAGLVEEIVGQDEVDEAKKIVIKIQQLLKDGHPDVEGAIVPKSCAILARNRYLLIAVEKALGDAGIQFYKRISAIHENESDIAEDFQLALRVYANPKDAFHLGALVRNWGFSTVPTLPLLDAQKVLKYLQDISEKVEGNRAVVVVNALNTIAQALEKSNSINLMPGIKSIQDAADRFSEEDRRAVYNDMEVLKLEWDQYIRARNLGSRSIGGFLSQMALGTTQTVGDGVGLLTVHSSKGLEFDVVFVMGMADGIFPDYRSRENARAQAEERRNAFVAVTRSRRLLYLTYARQRTMPWGDVWVNKPSVFLTQIMAQFKS